MTVGRGGQLFSFMAYDRNDGHMTRHCKMSAGHDVIFTRSGWVGKSEFFVETTVLSRGLNGSGAPPCA